MILPADSHMHSEWSWGTGGPTSAAAGRMELMCALAVRIGLPAVVFTEHVDFDDAWRTTRENVIPHQQSMLDPDGYLRPPPLNVDGYVDSIERCRHRYPQLLLYAARPLATRPALAKHIYRTGYQNISAVPDDMIVDYLAPTLGSADGARFMTALLSSMTPSLLAPIRPALGACEVPTAIVWGAGGMSSFVVPGRIGSSINSPRRCPRVAAGSLSPSTAGRTHTPAGMGSRWTGSSRPDEKKSLSAQHRIRLLCIPCESAATASTSVLSCRQ